MANEARIDRQSVDTLRFLALDAIQKANSGHPGLPLDAAPMAYALWSHHLRHDPTEPQWPDRDRFVLSAGHGSALLYALLHLFGYALPIEELEAFRQWGSRTPGHPESGRTPGVEMTTGPLGQGIANAVGLAIAERHLAAGFNRPDHTIVSHFTYALVSDGDLMEGISYEACSLAGHLRLGKLIVLYDSNDICLAGTTSLSISEDVAGRFAAAGWGTARVEDGNDLLALDRALAAAKAQTDRPTLIEVKTVLGYGAPTKQNTYAAHGSPLGAEETAATKRALGWPESPPFLVPEEVRAHVRECVRTAAASRTQWERAFAAYRAAFPDLAAEFERRMSGDLPADWSRALPSFPTDAKGLATRKASESALQKIGTAVPELIGGSADLNPSTLTWLQAAGDFEAPKHPSGAQGAVGGPWSYAGRNLHFGIREHAMGAVANGVARHGGLIAYTATFLAFADYMRAPIRLAALSGYPTIFVYTHDSIGVGEDGPTHQPIEQLMSLRLIPDVIVLRPGDANETVESWRIAIERRDGPTILILTRQNLPTLDRSELAAATGVRRGGYVLWESTPAPELIVIGTGSELFLALAAARSLAADGIHVRVVSMPSWELFEAQDAEYRAAVLPAAVTARVAVEAGRSLGWERYVGSRGRVIAVDRFGESAPGPIVFREFGLTADAVAAAARALLSR